MNIKSKKGFVGIDMTLAIVAVIIFSVLIIALLNNIFSHNLKVNKKALATVYLTETLENIGIAKYEDITQENIDNKVINLIPQEALEKGYTIDIKVDEKINLEDEETEDIFKKIKVTISYNVKNKNYEYYMERLKAKE